MQSIQAFAPPIPFATALAVAPRGAAQSVEPAADPGGILLYEQGGHGFGTGRTGTTSTRLLDDFIAWMRMHRLLGERGE